MGGGHGWCPVWSAGAAGYLPHHQHSRANQGGRRQPAELPRRAVAEPLRRATGAGRGGLLRAVAPPDACDHGALLLVFPGSPAQARLEFDRLHQLLRGPRLCALRAAGRTGECGDFIPLLLACGVGGPSWAQGRPQRAALRAELWLHRPDRIWLWSAARIFGCSGASGRRIAHAVCSYYAVLLLCGYLPHQGRHAADFLLAALADSSRHTWQHCDVHSLAR
mmetsp:Transcript_40953/g.97649  ORF Transcript_40953/g.97649 Transcript_40953/m.97649 type:complete len:221 (+) Transcript_40953:125-787(+)